MGGTPTKTGKPNQWLSADAGVDRSGWEDCLLWTRPLQAEYLHHAQMWVCPRSPWRTRYQC